MTDGRQDILTGHVMKDRLAPLWPTEVSRHTFGDISVELNVIKDFDAVLDHCADEHPNNTDMIPYYAHLWPSAEALGTYLVETFSSLSGKCVLELGCGLGLPSILCAKLGARVIASDFHPDNRHYFEQNAKRNDVPDITYRQLNWATPETEEIFDIIVGSDLLYEAQQIHSLTHCVKTLLRQGGMFILADPGRDHIQTAMDVLSSDGFTHRLKVINNTFIVTFRAQA